MTDYFGDLARRAADTREEFLPASAPPPSDPGYEHVTDLDAADPFVERTERRLAAAEDRSTRPAYRPAPEFAQPAPQFVTEEVVLDAPTPREEPVAPVPLSAVRPTVASSEPPPIRSVSREPTPALIPPVPVVRPPVAIEAEVVAVTEEVRADVPAVRPTPTAPPTVIEHAVERVVESVPGVADAPQRQVPVAASPARTASPVRPTPATENPPRFDRESEVETASPVLEREIVPRPSLPLPPVRPIGRGVPSVASAPSPPADTIVHVSIGRVEVRATVAPKKAAAAPAARPAARSLEDYLRGPTAGGAS